MREIRKNMKEVRRFSLKMVMERWFFSFFAAGVVPTVVRTHVVATTVCATESVHTLTCCTHIFWCTYSARTLRTFSCVLHTCMAQGCLQCACHVSLDSPSQISCFTRPYLCLPCCSLTVTSRPLLEAQVKRTPHEDELFGYLAKSAFNRRLWAQEVRQGHICGQWHDVHWRYLRLFENHRKNIGQFGVSAEFEFPVSPVFHWWFCFSERKQRKHATGKQLLDREKEKKEKVLWSVLQGWCQWKVDGTELGVILQRLTDNSILMIEISEYTWSEELNKLVLVKIQLRKKILDWERHGDRKFGTKKFRTRNIWVTTRAWISKEIFHVQIKLSVRGYILEANWRWRIVLTRIASQEVAKILKSWEYAAIRKKILKNNKDWNNFFMQDDEESRTVSLFFHDLDLLSSCDDLRSSSSCYLEFVESLAAKLECHEIHEKIWGIPWNVFDCQHARRDPDESHSDSRNLATLLGILRTVGIEESESEEPSQSTPLLCS